MNGRTARTRLGARAHHRPAPGLARLVALCLVAATLVVPAHPAAAGPVLAADPGPAADRSVPVRPVASRVHPLAPVPALPADPPVWPTAASAVLDLNTATVTGGAVSASIGRLPVRVSPLGARRGPDIPVAGAITGADPAPARVRVDVVPAAAVSRASYPVALRLTPAGGGTGAVQVALSYASFRHAYGGDWDTRLRLVDLPPCVLTTPRLAECLHATDLGAVNNERTGVLSAPVRLAAGGTVVALTAGASSDVGDFTKTSFHNSYTWQAGGAGGEFNWSYPMTAPPVPGDLTPQVAWNYSSGAVDGQTVGQNVQPLFGEGWDGTQGGYIERAYRACRDDTANSPVYPNATADECWRLPNARMVLGGKAVELVFDDATQTWHASDDAAAKVEYLTNDTVNGAYNNEHWRVTTVDGTQYNFGLNRLPGWQSGDRETKSVLTTPVFANHSGEPCFNNAGFASSWCSMAYRWNLDYVVDRLGNTMSYWYSQETDLTALAGNASAVTSYVRASALDRIEYGTRAGTGATRESSPTATPPARMVFTNVDRCLSGSCPTHDRNNYPDTPWDLDCSAAPCTNNMSPSYWSGRRVSQVATEVWSGTGSTYNRVDEWAFDVAFPGDASGNPLWLTSITHTGKDGTALATAPLQFGGVPMQNRADYDPNGTMANPMKYRITSIRTEAGGEIDVTYSGQDPGCQFGGAFPDPDNNANRCFPRYWTNPTGSSGWAWWHKYIVTKIVERDLVGGSPDVEHDYTYTTDGASTAVMWAHDDGAMLFTTPGAYKSYADWRGYPTVIENTGTPGGQQTSKRTLYFRGLAQDMTDAGEATRVSTITNSLGEVSQDYRQFSGLPHEVQILDGPGGQALRKTITDPARVALTATETHSDSWTYPTQLFAYIARPATERVLTWLPATGTWQTAQKTSTWNATYGVIASTDDQGDLAGTADDTCVRYSYTFPAAGAPYLIDFPDRVETVGVNCATTPTYPTDEVSDERTYYDGTATYTTAPTAGNATRTDAVTSFTGTTPVVTTQTTVAYDQWGRRISVKDALDHPVTYAYTQVAGLLASSTQTNALGHATTTTWSPGRALPLTVTDPNGKVTTDSYDALGRPLKQWRPGHPTTGTPDTEYQYTLQATAPSFVRTRAMGPNGNQIDSYEIFDGLLRPRQNQTTAPTGKRDITDTQYDALGQKVKESIFYDSTTAPASTLVAAADTAITEQHRFTYDNAGRQLTDETWSANVLKWKTSTIYGGDRTATLPPTGGTVTQDVADARGRLIEHQQYPGTTLTGTPIKTDYTYDHSGRLVKLVDPAGNQTTFTYDLLGHQTQAVDPDTGTSSATYDAAGRTTSTTDGRGTTLAYAYDNIDRPTELHATSLTGTLLAAWTYDPTGAKGQIASTTRYDAGLAYVTTVTGYNNFYQPTGSTVTIPPSTANGALAGTYTTATTYKTNGSVATRTLPAAGDLAAETLTYTYTTQGLASTFSSPLASYVSSTSYAFDGLVAQQLLGASGARVKIADSYDATTRRLTTVTTSTETATVGTYASKYSTTYGYDQVGNVTSAAGKTDSGAGLVADQEECYRYDYLRRLTTAWTQTSGSCTTPQRTGADPYWMSWTFDSIGNRLTQVDNDATAGNTTWNYTVGASGGVKPHQVKTISAVGPKAGPPTRTYGYDAGGDTTAETAITGVAQTLTWDAEGHLATVTAAGATTSYLYRVDGGQLMRRDPDGSATLYLDGQDVTQNAAGAVTATRYYGTVASRTAAGLTWLVSDLHGTGVISINATTLAPIRRRLLPYGEARGTQPSWPNTKGFVGGTAGPVGLTNLGAREYDPTTGRFISVDPMQDLKDPQQWHGYAYANNSPTTSSDPTGKRFYDTDSGGAITPTSQQVLSGSTIDHNIAVQIRANQIRAQYAVRDPYTKEMDYPRVTVETPISGASGENPGVNDGRADIVCWDCAAGVIYVWEVKPDTVYGEQDGKQDLDRYLNYLQQKLGETTVSVVAGPAIQPNPTGPHKIREDESMTIRSGTGADTGVEFYRVTKDEKQPAMDPGAVESDEVSSDIIAGVVGVSAAAVCAVFFVTCVAAITMISMGIIRFGDDPMTKPGNEPVIDPGKVPVGAGSGVA